jgi:hypothetical protein
MDIPERAGSGFTGKHGKDFLLFNDKWSQVLNMLEGPDGAVYMIDWYDKNECHHNDPNGHDQSNGRIFRISYGDVKFPKVDLQKLHDADLVSLLTSENRWHAGHARRILQERYAPHFVSATGPVYTVRVSTGARDSALENVTESLERILSSPGKISQKLRALWTLHAIHLVDDDRFLQAEQEDLRAWGIQLMTEDNAVSSKALKEFVRLAREDSSPVVRRYLASAMQRLPIQDRWDVIEALSQRAEDANDHNLPLMV